MSFDETNVSIVYHIYVYCKVLSVINYYSLAGGDIHWGECLPKNWPDLGDHPRVGRVA